MTWEEYTQLFDDILIGKVTDSLYNDPKYLEYVKLNNSRMNRWQKKGELTEELMNSLIAIQEHQNWILITEPWCGDAAHSAPFIKKMSDLSPNIQLTIQLRDGDESEIDKYLTNGNKSMPILIVRNENGDDLFTWGSTPQGALELIMQQKSSDKSSEDKKAEIQMWYNNDQGKSVQAEILKNLKNQPIKAH